MKIIDKLKENKFVDQRELWSAGMLKRLIGGAVGAALNMRYISVFEDTLYILKNEKKEIVVEYALKKEEIINITSKAGFLFLEVILTIETSNFTEKYTISSNKKAVKEIVELFK